MLITNPANHVNTKYDNSAPYPGLSKLAIFTNFTKFDYHQITLIEGR